MSDNSTPEVVTEDEAIGKVKKWSKEMNWEKALEGCKEILEVDPNNEEVKALLAQAEKGIAERPTQAPVPTPVPAETITQAVTEVIKPVETETQKATTAPPPSAPVSAPVPASVATPPAAPTPTPAPSAAAAPVPQRKNKSTVVIAAFLGFLIIVLLIIALVFGWLNPVFDWIFSLIG